MVVVRELQGFGNGFLLQLLQGLYAREPGLAFGPGPGGPAPWA